MASDDVSFPRSSVKLYETNGIDTLVDVIVRDAHGLGRSECPNFWMGIDEIRGDAQRHVVEKIVSLLYFSVMQSELPDKFCGAEWWLQVRLLM